MKKSNSLFYSKAIIIFVYDSNYLLKIVFVEKKKTGKWQAGQFRLLDFVSCVAELDHILTPGRYVGLPEEDDDFNFEDSSQH